MTGTDFEAWFASLAPEDQAKVRDEVNFGLWWHEYHFRDFPTDPAYDQKHADDDGQVWTYCGPGHGWAIVGADRPPRPKCAGCDHVRSAHHDGRCVLCDDGAPDHAYQDGDAP